jgi:hypothetical protein
MGTKIMAALAAALLAPVAVTAPTAATAQTTIPGIGQRVVVTNTGNVTATFVGGEAGYSDTLYLVGRSGPIFNNKTSSIGSIVDLGSFAAGTELVFRLNALVSGTPTNGTSYDYFTGPADRNPDGIEHAAANTVGNSTVVGFEDLLGGGDRDFNDLTFSFTNTAATAAVPEPASWAMMMLGFGAVGFAMRSAKRRSDVKFDMKIKRIAAGLEA